LNDIPDNHRPYMIEFAQEHFSRKRFRSAPAKQHLYDLAILVNPDQKEPPSNKKAIQQFIETGKSMGFDVELITKDDYGKIPEYDALFIRETTAVNHYTYRFSRMALTEGLIVIDDPVSILKCTNKVFLAELLYKAKVPIPKTVIAHQKNVKTIEERLGMPCILKQPDSSFSQGVFKVDTPKMLKNALKELLKSSDLVIAQEFIPTSFDWRIGILNKVPLYACKYYMAKNHWQIYNWSEMKRNDCLGDVDTLAIEDVDAMVVKTALKAANLIGDGFYGVDLKQIGNKVIVIEVNDNPSIDYGIEDAVLKENLYRTIMNYFLDRIRKRYNH
ncbi:MAG: ATP-grasp domain-containing protein, partial [bacterium]